MQWLRPSQKLARKPLSSLIETKRLMKCGQAKAVSERIVEEGAVLPGCWVNPQPRKR